MEGQNLRNLRLKLVFSPFFWTFSPVFFVLFWPDIRYFQEKSSGNTGLSSSQLSLDAIEGNFFLNIIFPTILEKNGNQKSSAIDFIFKPSDRFSLWTLA